jgi:hypothetical protein
MGEPKIYLDLCVTDPIWQIALHFWLGLVNFPWSHNPCLLATSVVRTGQKMQARNASKHKTISC